MFYHAFLLLSSMGYESIINKTRNEMLITIICPTVNHELIYKDDEIINTLHYVCFNIYCTKEPITSEWPIKREKDEKIQDDTLLKALRNNDIASDVTFELFSDSITLIDSGNYKEYKRNILDKSGQKYCFFISPINNTDVDHNYEYVIKPLVKQYGFSIERADEIHHTEQINDVILASIDRSKFLIADLTDERPNCYYEIGYAHSRNKPVIIIAKQGTTRHFDISTYKWNYWNNYQDLKILLESEITTLISRFI